MTTIFLPMAVLPAAASPNGRGVTPHRVRLALFPCQPVAGVVARTASAASLGRPGFRSSRVSASSCAPNGAHAQGHPVAFPDSGVALHLYLRAGT